MPYIKNLWVTHNEELLKDIIPPDFIEAITPVKDFYASHTSLKSNKMQKTNAVQLEGEVYVCQA